MAQQYPFGNPNDKYKKKLFVDTGMEYIEVNAKVVEPYIPPAARTKTKELEIINAPSHFHQMGVSSYKATLTLLFPTKEAYHDYLTFCGWTHKFYDEKGSIYLGALENIKPSAVEASTRYKVEIDLVLIKKDEYGRTARYEFQDIEGHWAEVDIEEMSNLGLITVISKDGYPVLYFRPNAYITRAEFVAFLNRTRRFMERVLRE